MIRFQICIFDILNTAVTHWYAFDESCDSLSNLYLWHIKYSLYLDTLDDLHVVIRFQICIFDILNTALVAALHSTRCCDSLSNLYLWHIKYSGVYRIFMIPSVVIRFQICIFDILNTANYSCRNQTNSCDSLSNLYLWHIKYSCCRFARSQRCVVIRFQICIFDILNTAIWKEKKERHVLWFAFKFVSLTY